MRFEDKENSVNLEEEIFKMDEDMLENSGWLWWFWLFFIDNPDEVEEPRQLAILWSRKDEKSITCNDRKFEFNESKDGNLEGVVASWYFDGEEMNHNFMLDKRDLKIDSSSLKTEGKISTSFHVEEELCKIKLGDGFHFLAVPRDEQDFAINSRSSGEYPFGLYYSMLKSNRLDLESEIKGETLNGSAYFQRVFFNAPAPSWYWGIFHFENGGFLDYYKPYILGKSLKEEIAFYDGQKKHQFHDIDVKINNGNNLPTFHISAKNNNDDKKINFTVKPYSRSSWKFKKKIAKIIPNRLTYREYPAKISELELVDREKDRKVSLNDLGSSIGNAEHATGLLL